MRSRQVRRLLVDALWALFVLGVLLLAGLMVRNGCVNRAECQARGYVWVPTRDWHGGVCVTGIAP